MAGSGARVSARPRKTRARRTGAAGLCTSATQLAASGDLQLALHVIDLLALAPGDGPELASARSLKAEWLRARAEGATSFVSKSLFLSSANLIENGEGGSFGIR